MCVCLCVFVCVRAIPPTFRFIEGRGCEICGGDDHNDKMLLCDGKACDHAYETSKVPVKE